MRKTTFPEIKLENASCPCNFRSRDIKIYFPSIGLRECEFRQSHRFFFITSVSKIIRTQSTRVCMKYKQKVRGTIKQFKIKGLSSCYVLNLRMSGENCLIFNWHSSWAPPGVSIFRVPTKGDEYSVTWRNNIVAVITRDTVIKPI